MEYVRLGRSGVKVSRICLGMMTYGDEGWRDWVLDEEQAEPIVRRAVEAGITFFDTADVYSRGVSEEVTGRLLKKLFRDRDDYVVATKVRGAMGDGPNDRGLSRKHILASIDASLSRLGLDHVDLYQIHRWDNETPIEETLSALDDVVRAGKARYIGASSMFAWQFSKATYLAERLGWTSFVSMQNHFNLLYREEEREMVPLCGDLGVGVIPWSPLARGWLTGSKHRGEIRDTARGRTDAFADLLYDESDVDVVEAVLELADERAVPPAAIALAWLLRKPEVTAPIIGASRVGHVDDAVAAVGLELSDAEVHRLETSYRPHAIRGHA